MKAWLGTLIKRERLRQNLSQEGLCRGICVVSYLSKIETGRVEAGEDILSALMNRLGLRYETDGEVISRLEAVMDQAREALFSGHQGGKAFEGHMDRLEAERDVWAHSRLMLYGRLLLALGRGGEWRDMAEYAASMTEKEYELFLLLRVSGGEGGGEELMRLHPRGCHALTLGVAAYERGRYFEAIERLLRAWSLSAEEGSLRIMCLSRLYLGNCYSDCGQKELMLQSYGLGQRMARELGERELSDTVEYNVGSTYLSWDMAREAYERLAPLDWDSALYRHKMAIALEKLGRRREAMEEIQKARQAEGDRSPEVDRMLDLVEYRLEHGDYLDSGEYARMLTDTFNHLKKAMPAGYARFHLPYMLEMLEKQRRYKEAYQLMREFSQGEGINGLK